MCGRERVCERTEMRSWMHPRLRIAVHTCMCGRVRECVASLYSASAADANATLC